MRNRYITLVPAGESAARLPRTPYLLASSGCGFSLVQRYDSTLPDWQKRSDDRHFIGDINDDGKADPLIYNDQD